MSLNARGLTLVEVVVATAIVLTTCVAVTAATVTATRAGGRSQHDLKADEVLQCEAARLRSLPFCAPMPAGWPVSHALPAPSAVGELFPHADETLDEGAPGYVATGELAGAFVSTVAVGVAEVRRTAWMAWGGQGGWRALRAAQVAGWHGWSGEPLPGAALIVRLETPIDAGPTVDLGSAGDLGSVGDLGSASPSPAGRTRTLTLVLTSNGDLAAVDPHTLDDFVGEAAP